MKKTLLFVLCMFLFSVFTGFNFVEKAEASGSTLHVGTGQTYSIIQDAVDNASSGDTIYVHSGTYYENVVIDKSITIQGENKDNTIIYGEEDKECIKVAVDDVTITNVMIKNNQQTSDESGIWLLEVNNCQIKNTIISSDFKTSWDGVVLHSCSNSLIDSNLIYNCRYGVYMDQSTSDLISNNDINENTGGICLNLGGSNTITSNSIHNNNLYAIHFGDSNGNTVVNNEISDSTYDGLSLSISTDNLLYNNNFIGNGRWNANDRGDNIWYDESLGEGNNWDDYTGTDNNGDGIGDIPYDIHGGDNQDLYPLMPVGSASNNAPDAPMSPSPSDDAAGVALRPTISAYINDADGDTLTVSFYEQSGTLIGNASVVGSGTASVVWSGANQHSTVYSWYVVADDENDSAQSSIWSFTTKGNTNIPPDKPQLLNPINNAKDQSMNVTLKIYVEDDDNDNLNITFYNYDNNKSIDTTTISGSGNAIVIWTNLNGNTKYSWYAKVSDDNVEVSSDIFSFTTKSNNNQGDNNDLNNNNDTPGFTTLLLITAIVLFIFWKKRNKT